MKKDLVSNQVFLCWQLPIFPGRRQPSIFGTNELNYRVRNGNGWTLIVIDTNCNVLGCSDEHILNGAPTGIRTRDTLIKSQVLYQLSYWCILHFLRENTLKTE